MAEVFNTTIQSVEPRTVTRRSDGQQITLWEVTDGQGVVWTARKDVANIARQMLGYPVTMVRRVEQKGEYTNRYLDSVSLNGEVPLPQMQPVSPPPYVAQAQAAQAGAASQPAPQAESGGDEKSRQIHRQTAAKVAATLQGQSESMLDFWANTKALARYFDTGEVPTFIQEGSQYEDDIPF